jgi:putative FmdB family regulatory protein
MPIYPYSCQHCHHELEALQKVSDNVLTTCPNCKEEKLVKMLSSPSFHLSGGGWFRDEKTKPTQAAPAPKSEASSN